MADEVFATRLPPVPIQPALRALRDDDGGGGAGAESNEPRGGGGAGAESNEPRGGGGGDGYLTLKELTALQRPVQRGLGVFDNWATHGTTHNAKSASVWGKYAKQKGPYAVEELNPEPYGGPLTKEQANAVHTGHAHLAPFLFEVCDVQIHRPANSQLRDPFYGLWAKKIVTVQARVMPRAGDRETLGNDGALDKDGAIKLRFQGAFEVDRPDAVCLRELIMLALRHELEECIMVGARRVWDPHKARPFNI